MHTENSHALHNMHIKYCGNIKFSEHRLEKKKQLNPTMSLIRNN